MRKVHLCPACRLAPELENTSIGDMYVWDKVLGQLPCKAQWQNDINNMVYHVRRLEGHLSNPVYFHYIAEVASVRLEKSVQTTCLDTCMYMLWFYMIYIQTALLSKRPIGTRNGDTLPFKSIFFNISGGVEPPWAVEIPDQLLLLSLRRPNSFFFCSHSLHTQKNKDLWGYAPTMNPV